MAILRSLQEISMARFVPYPTLVVSVTMTALHMESATRRSTSTYSSRPARETEVIIVNVAGYSQFFQTFFSRIFIFLAFQRS